MSSLKEAPTDRLVHPSLGSLPPMDAQRKRVLFIIPGIEGGGAERFVSTLLRHLDRSCVDPHLAILEAKEEIKQYVPTDVLVHRLKSSRIRYALPAIVRLVKKIRPQAVLSTLSHVNFALVLGRALFPSGTRLFLREASLASLAVKDQRHPQLWEWLYRRCYRRADGVVCSSDAMADDLVTHFGVPREKVVRIYNPVDVKMVREMAAAERSPFAGAGPHLVAAGRLSREKGLDVLLAAMPAVLARHPQARLIILGEGALRADLNRQAEALGLADVVAFPGFQPNPWPYFRHADVFVLPSRYEGLPNVLLEALSLGTPVIATDCPGGIRELQALSGGVITVPPENPQALADAIVATCNRRRPSRDHKGKLEEGLRSFDLQETISEYTRLLLS